ncbi:cytochrome c oxidase assembly protein COX16 homolog, mitochondrial isoform X2 [Cygnus olor]|uniref:cytochrome c oxidase assembly protein COX16 homolog, mitochondrial isoform X2 n=2 Tax=Cygnus olor TaxID=8869 RepID=UPI001ADE6FBC|nr:cytochrome c oxidase assembly protein COX16 homolog, mitochondrial isoform X2 [Cygnus olor]XP_040416291.1 cytochrome c oxidase assembly protein COX16 homolog, mitochondrial isoform X2 [Cygnus olor]
MSTNYMARCLRKMFCFDCRKSRGIELNALLLPHFSEIQMKRRLLTGETHSAAIVDPALKEKLKQNNVTLESEYKKLEKSDLDNWENIRGPQLWEDSRAVQKQRREAARLKTE